MFDPRLALTFACVAETLSFTRTAEQLGVAQPWVSEQVRRLEEQLGFRLLERTSRRVELTPQGELFLAYARSLTKANDAAQKFARETRAEAEQTLRIGAPEMIADLPERIALIDRFVLANPMIQLQIHAGAVPALIARLKRGELDVVVAYASSADPGDELEATVICSRIAHLLMPAEDPLASLDAIPLPALAGRTMISSPGRTDPNALRQAFAAFVASGAVIQPAPESMRTTIEHYARIRRLICLRWRPVRMKRVVDGDMVCAPIDDASPPSIKVALLRPRGARRMVERFCEMGGLVAREAVAAGG